MITEDLSVSEGCDSLGDDIATSISHELIL